MTIEGIRKTICQSGYVLEIEIADLLQRNGWDVFFQYPYLDKKQEKIRKIDLLCFRRNLIVDYIPNPSQILGSLVIECKKSTKHGWAFHTIKKEGSQAAFWTVLDLKERVKEIKQTQEQDPTNFMNNFHPLKKDTRIGTLCCIPPKHPDDFYEALNQILSDITYGTGNIPRCITFPVIVFDGPIWEFYKENGELKIKEINYLQYLSAIIEKQEVKPCLIDIVKSTYFNDFVELIEKSFKLLS